MGAILCRWLKSPHFRARVGSVKCAALLGHSGGRIWTFQPSGVALRVLDGPLGHGEPVGQTALNVIDVRMELQTDDDAMIYAAYRQIVYAPQDQGQRYFVTTPVFETGSPKYDWVNRVVAVGVVYPVSKEMGNVAHHRISNS